MHGLMMDTPLLVSSLIRHADAIHGGRELVTRTVEGPIHRYTYRDAHARSRRLANALGSLGIAAGDRLGTIAWNTNRHFEIYYGVSGMGAVCHTLNPRLHADQLVYVINHARDRYLFVDTMFLPTVAEIAHRLPHLEGVIVLAGAKDMPADAGEALCYEELLASASDAYDWPVLDERAACSLCYTSGTTGNPKGVLYSNRSTVLHAMAIAWPAVLHLSDRETVLPIVPMFHANAWGVPYAATMTGAKLVFPGPHMDGASLHALIEGEGVTFSAGVPTIWQGVLQHLRQSGGRLDSLQRVVIGGSACPPSMITELERDYGVEVRHGWGMTEMSPVGAINTLQPGADRLGDEARLAIQAKQGRPLFGVEMKIVGDDGTSQPWDGTARGELKVRGPWICSAYYESDDSSAHAEAGWFATNDVATIDADGYLQLVDRKKDMVKSGGEWISSIDLENIALGHPAVAQAAVIAVPHPRWVERPLLLVKPAEGAAACKQDIREYLAGRVAKWWVPDDIVFVEAFPIGGTGKILKSELRAQYKDHVLPGAE